VLLAAKIRLGKNNRAGGEPALHHVKTKNNYAQSAHSICLLKKISTNTYPLFFNLSSRFSCFAARFSFKDLVGSFLTLTCLVFFSFAMALSFGGKDL
jgi:hypothetical protein